MVQKEALSTTKCQERVSGLGGIPKSSPFCKRNPKSINQSLKFPNWNPEIIRSQFYKGADFSILIASLIFFQPRESSIAVACREFTSSFLLMLHH